jgi:hypothetical protein
MGFRMKKKLFSNNKFRSIAGLINIFVLPGLLFIVPGCEKNNLPKGIPQGIPQCIENKIIDISEEPVWNPPAKVFSYRYNGETVYFFPSRCCDIPSVLYDENCNFICSPDGGLSGGGDGQCTDFFSARSDEKLVWEDLRK